MGNFKTDNANEKQHIDFITFTNNFNGFRTKENGK